MHSNNKIYPYKNRGFLGGASGEEPAYQCRRQTWVSSLGWEYALGEEMAAHSSILVWRIPGIEEPGRLQSIGSQRVRHARSNLGVHSIHIKIRLCVNLI